MGPGVAAPSLQTCKKQCRRFAAKVQDQTFSVAVGAQVWRLQVLRELDAAEYEEAPLLHAPTSLGDALGGLHGRQRSAGDALPALGRGKKRLSCITQIKTQDSACARCAN